MKYKVKLKPAARRQLDKLEIHAYLMVREHLLALEDEPRPRDVVKLTAKNLWRIHAGHFRVVFEVDDNQGIITVVRIARRNEATYRGF